MRNKNMQLYRFYMRPRADYPYPCANFDKTWFGETLSAAVAQARNLNKGRKGMEIYKVEEISCGETEYL